MYIFAVYIFLFLDLKYNKIYDVTYHTVACNIMCDIICGRGRGVPPATAAAAAANYAQEKICTSLYAHNF